jgi:hypothetical protein
MRLSLVLLAVLTTACSGVRGSGTAQTEMRELGAFTALSVSGSARLEVTQGPAQQVKVTADDNLLPLLRTEIVDGTLRFRPTESIRPDTPIVLSIVTVAPLRALTVSGAVDGAVTRTGAGALAIKASGAVDLTLRGAADALNVELSGAGAVDAAALSVAQAQVAVSGAGRVTLDVRDALKATVSGAGVVRYSGRPKVTQSVSGVGKVTPL